MSVGSPLYITRNSAIIGLYDDQTLYSVWKCDGGYEPNKNKEVLLNQMRLNLYGEGSEGLRRATIEWDRRSHSRVDGEYRPDGERIRSIQSTESSLQLRCSRIEKWKNDQSRGSYWVQINIRGNPVLSKQYTSGGGGNSSAPKSRNNISSGTLTYNCISTVKRAGFYVPQTKDGYARTVPVTSTNLPPIGKKVVIKTADSVLGHISVAVWNGKQLVTVIDSAFGAGRVVPLSKFRGYI